MSHLIRLPLPRPSRTRRWALIGTIVVSLGVALGMAAMHASPGAMPATADMSSMDADGIRDSVALVGPDAGRLVAAHPSTAPAMSTAGASPSTSPCLVTSACTADMSSMACPVAPAPGYSLHAPAVRPLTSSITIAADLGIPPMAGAAPARAPDLHHLSISRT